MKFIILCTEPLLETLEISKRRKRKGGKRDRGERKEEKRGQ
jgi:hypothetical protein